MYKPGSKTEPKTDSIFQKAGMSLTLVILAAGRGTRYGGNKPLAEVGPHGQSLFEYSVYDSFRAGFQHVIFVVDAAQDTAVYKKRLAGFGDRLKVDFVTQELNTGIADREIDLAIDSSGKGFRSKPWGTGHAVLVCQNLIANPFVVINADDYYGRLNFEVTGNYLLDNRQNPQVCVLPGYKLKNTLSNSGGVNRGICSVCSDGYLTSIDEVRNICLDNSSSLVSDHNENNVAINGDSIVSMTFWGFHPSIFTQFDSAFRSFLKDAPDLINDEFYIPQVIDQAIKRGMLKPRLIPTTEKWKGLTYTADLPEVRNYLAELTDAGFYPELNLL